jgi:hypothetical protein
MTEKIIDNLPHETAKGYVQWVFTLSVGVGWSPKGYSWEFLGEEEMSLKIVEESARPGLPVEFSMYMKGPFITRLAATPAMHQYRIVARLGYNESERMITVPVRELWFTTVWIVKILEKEYSAGRGILRREYDVKIQVSDPNPLSLQRRYEINDWK